MSYTTNNNNMFFNQKTGEEHMDRLKEKILKRHRLKLQEKMIIREIQLYKECNVPLQHTGISKEMYYNNQEMGEEEYAELLKKTIEDVYGK